MKKHELTKEAYERILVLLDYARPADSENPSAFEIETNEEIDELQEAIKIMIKHKRK